MISPLIPPRHTAQQQDIRITIPIQAGIYFRPAMLQGNRISVIAGGGSVGDDGAVGLNLAVPVQEDVIEGDCSLLRWIRLRGG